MTQANTTELEAVNTILSAIGEAPVNTLTGTIGDVAASMPRYLMGEMAGMVAYYYQLTVRPDRWWDAMRVMDRLYTSLEPVPKTGDNMRLQLAFHSTALIQSAMGE